MSKDRSGVCVPKGFLAHGTNVGIKPAPKLDCALIVSEKQACCVGVFTTNKIKAASVEISQNALPSTQVRAVIITSGNANAANGEPGLRAAQALCRELADELGVQDSGVVIAQTGLIGVPFPIERVQGKLRTAVSYCQATGGSSAAKAIMTTDSVSKETSRSCCIGGKQVHIGGMAKGAGMISPAMATMLSAITTDAHIQPELMQKLLNEAVDDSFHALTIDGCRSTNDTVFFLANGASEAPELTESSAELDDFRTALTSVLRELAIMIAKDAEGASKFLLMKVEGANSIADARRAAKTVCNSLLVKCSLAGENAYWGRVLSELGASGAELDPTAISISYGQHTVVQNGGVTAYDEEEVGEYMRQRDITITAHLGVGSCSAECYSCDLTYDYVTENMGKS